MKGRATKEGRYVALIFAAFFAVFYLHSSYSSIFETKPAFLYDADSGSLYSLQMTPYLTEHNKWDAFNPFSSLAYVYPAYEDRVGNLDELIAEKERSNRLYDQDPDAWNELQIKELDEIIQATESSILDFWRIEIFHKAVPDGSINIPEALRAEISDHGNLSFISPVEAILVHSVTDLDRPEAPDQREFYEISNGFLIEGAAAYEVEEALY